MSTTVATIEVGGTGANTAAGALTALGAAPLAAYAAANSAGLPTTNIQSSASFTAVKSNHYFLFSTTAATVTLPLSPNTGDAVWVTVCNGLANNVIGRNSEKIMGLAENMTIDVANSTVQLRYANTAAGWTL